MKIPDDLQYTREHEWCRIEGDRALVGITDHAQAQLGDIVLVELPEAGDEVKKGDAFGVVESTKAVSELFAPVSGKVLEVNDPLSDAPETINEDPYGEGWLIRLELSEPGRSRSSSTRPPTTPSSPRRARTERRGARPRFSTHRTSGRRHARRRSPALPPPHAGGDRGDAPGRRREQPRRSSSAPSPSPCCSTGPLDLPPALDEIALLAELRRVASRNGTEPPPFIGAGAYPHHVPPAVDQLLLRGELFTSYTPYQPEVSQGTLQALFEWQTFVALLTGLEVSNASMYDGASATAEGALMAMRVTGRRKVVVSAALHPRYRAVLRTYLASTGAALVTLPYGEDGRHRPRPRSARRSTARPRRSSSATRTSSAWSRTCAPPSPPPARRGRSPWRSPPRRWRSGSCAGPASSAPTSPSAPSRASATRSASAARRPASSPPARRTCARCRGGCAAPPSTSGAGAASCSPSPPASSTSGARRRRPTSAPTPASARSPPPSTWRSSAAWGSPSWRALNLARGKRLREAMVRAGAAVRFTGSTFNETVFRVGDSERVVARLAEEGLAAGLPLARLYPDDAVHARRAPQRRHRAPPARPHRAPRGARGGGHVPGATVTNPTGWRPSTEAQAGGARGAAGGRGRRRHPRPRLRGAAPLRARLARRPLGRVAAPCGRPRPAARAAGGAPARRDRRAPGARGAGGGAPLHADEHLEPRHRHRVLPARLLHHEVQPASPPRPPRASPASRMPTRSCPTR